MRFHRNASRHVSVAVVLAAVLALPGCSWFHKENKLYAGDPTSRPLEVPPDLDLPRPDAAMASGGSASAPVATAGAAGGFTVTGNRDEVYARTGEALAAIDGVAIASQAQALGVYDVSYAGSNFLIRVAEVAGGVNVAAVDPRGQPATGEGAARVMATLRSTLGSN
jgi:uncharacterized lipoprotein